MLYIETNSDHWSLKHGIEPQEFTCEGCGENYKTTVPVLMKGYAGLETPIHKCGEKFIWTTFVPTSQEEKTFWKTGTNN